MTAKAPRISILHPYLENRFKEVKSGKYPRHHLWGINAIEQHQSWNSKFINTSTYPIPKVVESLLNKTFFRGSPGCKVELSAIKASQKTDLIYSVCGPLTLSRYFPKKLVSWTFRNPPVLSTFQLAHRAYRARNLHSQAGFLCLTPMAKELFSEFAPSRFLPWCVDLDLFDGALPISPPVTPFFLASGKTERDYKSLINATTSVNAEVRIIGPRHLRPSTKPTNLTWIDSSMNPPDKAIDYKTLKEWYAQCTAVCIPLSGDAEDTCGYTNMLEAMAMRKPVLMTRSGCLHMNPEKGNFGKLIKPYNSQHWADSMNKILGNHTLNKVWGDNARLIAENQFSQKKFNCRIVKFLEEILAHG
ncbi:MAG: glycosyltransferase [Opitutales bacterium]|nr:glycosyltransferase [Opitutales bacterium]